jgi:1-acyl-sn-glycerol-3-phosphate acyltransferase
MVAKTELYKIPFWGRAMRATGFVEVNRSNRGQAIDALERAGRQIAGGTSVWIAPEGSRARDGKPAPLKKGGFHLAKQAGVPILPVALSGTHRVLPPGARSARYDQPVRVVIGAPIDSAASVDELMARVSAFFEDNVAVDFGAGADQRVEAR